MRLIWLESLVVMIFGCFSFTACITTEDKGFVNYKAIGDVFSTKPQTVDYEEIGAVHADESDFFWASCSKVCKKAVMELKYQAKNHGGDSIVNASYFDEDGLSRKKPTCVTQWSWAYLYILPVFGPWVQNCKVEGVAVSRVQQKKLHQNVQHRQQQGQGAINIKINNTQNNNSNVDKKPSH